MLIIERGFGGSLKVLGGFIVKFWWGIGGKVYGSVWILYILWGKNEVFKVKFLM